MSDFKYDEDSVKALIEWATTTQFPKEIRLTEAEHITDVALFVQTNIYDIEEHYPIPSIFRLLPASIASGSGWSLETDF